MRYYTGTNRRYCGVLLLLALLMGSVTTPAAAMDGKLWLSAYQAYMRKDYTTAQQGFALLLQGELTTTERAEMLSYNARCLQQLKRPAEAAAMLEALIELVPTDPNFEGLAFLYRHYLEIDATQKAEALWNTVIKQWGKTAGVWKLVGAHTDYLAQHDPAQVVKCAEQLGPLTIAKEDLIVAFYEPLFRYGHYEKAKEVHLMLQKYFTANRPNAVELDKRAYEDAISEGIVEAYFAIFVRAIEAGDLEAARTWLANLNATVPEHPHAVEARKMYRQKISVKQ